jgi:hypothetical protein
MRYMGRKNTNAFKKQMNSKTDEREEKGNTEEERKEGQK